MKKQILSFCLIALFFVPLHAQDCTPNIEWQESLGGDTTDEASSIIPTADGGYVVAGYTASNNGDVTDNHGEADFWVAKLASDGGLIWQIALGGIHEEKAHAVIQTSDGGYVIAGAARSNNGDVSGNHGIHDFWVVKLDANGSLVWQSALGGSAIDIAYDIIQTDDGGYAVAGLTYSNDGQVTGNHGQDDYWVVKLDDGGNLDWQKTFGGTGKDEAYSIKQTFDGGYIVAGYAASDDSDVTGNHGLADYWIVKLDATGNLSWQKALGGVKNDVANSIQQTTDGGYIVAGYTASSTGDVSDNHGNTDTWIVKLDTAGTLLWQKALGGGGFDYGNEIIQTVDGGYVTLSSTLSLDGDVTDNHGATDFWATKQDANGNLLWQKTLGGTAVDSAFSIKQTSDNGFIMAGFSNSNDGDVTGNHGFEDFWVVKLTSDVGAVNTYYADVDGDGYGDPTNSIDTTACTPPTGYLTDNTDCNDANAAINPAASEICNGIDDNCNAIIDEGLPNFTFYADGDNDGYGNANSTVNSCVPPVGFVADSTDCDDTNPNVNPGVLEVSNNGMDDNCNGVIDEFGVGIGEIENSSLLTISPNPATDIIILQLYSNSAVNAIISITNILGETIFEKISTLTNGTLYEEISFNKKFSEGMYYVKIRSDQQQWIKPLLVIK